MVISTSGHRCYQSRTEAATVGEALLYVVHDLEKLDVDPVAASPDAIISGHTHQPAIHWRKGVLFLNPGTVVTSRSGLRAAIALVEVESRALTARIIPVSTSAKRMEPPVPAPAVS